MALRIKPNVDLKELEKYGYKQGQDTTNVSYSAYGKVFELEYSVKLNDTLIDVIEIAKKTKEIECLRSSKMSHRSFVNGDEKLLKKYINDLIKDGFVEKVSD